MPFLREVEKAFGMDPSKHPLSSSIENSGLGDAVSSVWGDVKDIAPAAITLGIVGYGLKIIASGFESKKKRR